MIFSWLRRRRRERLLAQPFPVGWLTILDRNVAHYKYLSPAEQGKLQDDLRIFIAEKHWEGCGGLQITDEMQVTIAAQACLLVLGMEHNYFDRVPTILVYPKGFLNPPVQDDGNAIVIDEVDGRIGEAHYRGPVILSWKDVLYQGRHPSEGANLVFHEFAHQLDMLDGSVNGTPPLRDDAASRHWDEVMTNEYERLIHESEQGRATLLDQYGTKDEGEFFAVATECFFDKPMQLARRHPRLYELLRDYYRQDPAARCARKRPETMDA